MRAGYASSGCTPSPAVRLVPKNTIDRARSASPPPPCRVSSTAPASSAGRSVSSGGALLHASPRPSTPPHHARPIMLIARDLTKEYDSGAHRLTVLRDVSFSIPQGAFVSIIGPSGSGKTTLLGLLAGLDTPSRGSVVLDGADLGGLDEDGRARLRGEKVGFIFQSFQLIPTLTALENVQVPLELRGDPGAGDRAGELLQRVGLGD